mmetsp:Transcript_8004/g.22664  ORF Transcript_8004/g.22664 Transcript_8004/m.22664 type:complete len:226 (+) Transcript_8004:569-1246(+)
MPVQIATARSPRAITLKPAPVATELRLHEARSSLVLVVEYWALRLVPHVSVVRTTIGHRSITHGGCSVALGHDGIHRGRNDTLPRRVTLPLPRPTGTATRPAHRARLELPVVDSHVNKRAHDATFAVPQALKIPATLTPVNVKVRAINHTPAMAPQKVATNLSSPEKYSNPRPGEVNIREVVTLDVLEPTTITTGAVPPLKVPAKLMRAIIGELPTRGSSTISGA